MYDGWWHHEFIERRLFAMLIFSVTVLSDSIEGVTCRRIEIREGVIVSLAQDLRSDGFNTDDLRLVLAPRISLDLNLRCDEQAL
jgi:hypothetical protein